MPTIGRAMMPYHSGFAGAPMTDVDNLEARLDGLPFAGPVFRSVLLIALGFGFEIYDLFLTAYVTPGLTKAGYFSEASLGAIAHLSVIGIRGSGTFVFALFAGLFIGSISLGALADRYGRRTTFTVSLVWYSVCTAAMALQHSGYWIDLWRFLAGIGLGIELVTIDAYIAELVPPSHRGRAFAWCQLIGFSVVPVVAFLAWMLVPTTPFSIEGWRFVVLVGAVGALGAWYLRRRLPESPRWLVRQQRYKEASRVVTALETDYGRDRIAVSRPNTQNQRPIDPPTNHKSERTRVVMLSVFNFFQTFGYYGFTAWVPTLLIARGISVTTSLEYSFLIALANPVGPLLGLWLGDRLERKWQIVFAAIAVAIFGLAFAIISVPAWIIAFGAMTTVANNVMSYAFHGYQAEVFPTKTRSQKIGFVYAWSRLSAAISGPVIVALLAYGGAVAVFQWIALSMGIVILSIGCFGERTQGHPLEFISN